MDLPTEKRCSTCHRSRPLDQCYRAAKATDGGQARCKDCHKEHVAAYRARIRAHHAARVVPPDLRKRCPSCGETKPAGDFHRNRTSRDGLHWVCKRCDGGGPYSKEAEQRRRFRTYDVTPEEVEQLLRCQGGACAICVTPFEGSECNIDHCHRTGVVRGLLCAKCNTGLGLLGDDEGRLRAAWRYLANPPMRAIRPV
jgi:hypothetical protein